MASHKTIYLGAGCFWCVEAVFQLLKGVDTVRPGYMGGHDPSPTYERVCSGSTGHAEVLEVVYDAAIISDLDLLKVFWASHNPTTLNQQGADKGTQYRSAIYFTDSAQEIAVRETIEFALSIWSDPIVTEIAEASEFFVAESYHHNYFNDHGSQPYCAYVINPKVVKVKRAFVHLLK